MKITNASLKEFRADFASTIEELEKKHGVKIALGAINYSSNNFRTKMTVVNVDKDEIAEGKDSKTIIMETDFKSNAVMFGLKSEDLGKKFLCGGKTYTIVGSKARSYKYPILGSDGSKIFKFTKSSVKNGLLD
jgi:hypothetical protein